MPSTFTVLTTDDAGPGSLRQAILDANARPGLDAIAFDIGSGGVQTIRPTSALPVITDAVTLDGTSQPGYAGLPLIELDGGGAGFTANGLVITAGQSTVTGLVINRFGGGSAIVLQGPGDNVVAGNFIGTDVTGTLARPNGNGVRIEGSPAANNTIVGNLIAGNQANGVAIVTGNGTLVQANLIGTDITGTSALANGYGVWVFGGTGHQIGTPGAGNLISGNTAVGVQLDTPGNVVQGNSIGIDITGTARRGNVHGVVTRNGNRIGGAEHGEGNVISGNLASGILIVGNDNRVQGNFIGTDPTGTIALRNRDGISISNAVNNLIGGTEPGAGNLISGNDTNGIVLNRGRNSRIQGNLIGTDITGTVRLGNYGGIYVFNLSNGNLIGGTSPEARNLISGNANGVIISLSSSNQVQGNYIGTDVIGTAPLGNTLVGVGFDIESRFNLIGGTTSETRNIISANGIGLSIQYTDFNTVQGNYIGTDVAGSAPLGNSFYGVYIRGSASYPASSNLIGGTAPGAGNIISANGTGVYLYEVGTRGNVVQGNRIGTDATGASALGNGTGVQILVGASLNVIGGTAAGAGNVISGNTSHGVHVWSNAPNNSIQGNLIGLDGTGTAGLGNGGHGILLNAPNNTVGGTEAGAGNTIASNGQDGVRVDTAGGNAVRGNRIVGHNAGLGIRLSAGGNANQAFPVLTSAVTGGGITTLTGTLTSTPNTTFAIEFFANTLCHPSGFGEGERLLGALSVTSDAAGLAGFTFIVDEEIEPGTPISATATSAANNTSPFAACIEVLGTGGSTARAAALVAASTKDRESAEFAGMIVPKNGGKRPDLDSRATDDGSVAVLQQQETGAREHDAAANFAVQPDLDVFCSDFQDEPATDRTWDFWPVLVPAVPDSL